MFGAGRFDVARFDFRCGDDGDVRLGGEWGVQFRQMAGAGEDILEMIFAQEGVGVRAQGAAAALERAGFGLEVGQGASILPGLCVRVETGAAFGGGVRCVGEVWLAALWQGVCAGRAYFGRELRTGGAWGADVAVIASLGGDLRLDVWSADALFGQAAFNRQLVVDEAFLDVTLNPGDVLVLDSDTYIMERNGKNIIDAHTGAWLRLGPDIVDVRLAPQSGAGLEARMQYRVRWL